LPTKAGRFDNLTSSAPSALKKPTQDIKWLFDIKPLYWQEAKVINPTQTYGSNQHHTAETLNPVADKQSVDSTSRLDQLRDSPTTEEQIFGRPDNISRLALQETTADQLAAGNRATQAASGTHDHATDKKGAARFNGDKDFVAIAQGDKILKKGSTGTDVKKVQQALIDMGYNIPGGASGTFGQDTHDAIRHFQLDTGIGVDGKVGKNTLEALKQQAPAPGQKLVRSVEYDKLFADGRLNTTIAIGFDENGGHNKELRMTIQGLEDSGYKIIDYSSLSDAEKNKLGLTGDRYDPNTNYFHKTFTDAKTGKNVESVVRVIDPGSVDGKTARTSFMKALEQDEVVLYSGHARHGTGPDFDHKSKGDGNFVINETGNRYHSPPPAVLKNAIDGRGSDLDQIKAHPDYQLLIMNGCSTTEYMPSLRSSMFMDRNPTNTDLIVTNNTRWVATGSKHNIAFLNGITQRQTQPEMATQHNSIETDHSVLLNHSGTRTPRGNLIPPNEGYNTFFTNGLFGNDANQKLPK
jgi:peptidoglycan hydrolase-like protein with peptidoglycan-binding domain